MNRTGTRLHPALEIRTSAASSKQRYWYPLTLCLTALGFFGTLASALSLYQPSCNYPAVLLISSAAFLLAALFLPHRGFGRRVGILLVLLLLCLLAFAETYTIVGIEAFLNDIYHTAHHTDIDYFTLNTTDSTTAYVTFILSCAAALVAFFLVFTTICRPLFFAPVLITFVLIEPGLYMGMELAPAAAAPLLAYWFGMLALRLTLKRNQNKPRNMAAICGCCMAALTLLVYLTVWGCGTWMGYQRTTADRQRRTNLSQSLASIDLENLPEALRKLGSSLGESEDTEVARLGEKSQLVYTGEPELTLTFDTTPQKAIYLKGFTGTVYTDNTWLASTDFSDAAQAEIVEDVMKRFDCAPQNFSFLFQQSLQPDATLLTCNITSLQKTDVCYQPYASYSNTASFPDDIHIKTASTDSYSWIISELPTTLGTVLDQAPLSRYTFAIDESESDTVQKFLRALQLESNSVTVSARFSVAAAAETPAEIENKVVPAMLLESTAYRDYAADAYTELPEEDLSEVYAALPENLLAQKNPTTALEQLALLEDLQEWLASETTYTISPGKTPATRDFVSFFLLENKQGYCMHYATAGTILARYLGIPARYCEGYLVNEDAENDGTTYTLTDEQSHAWCEVYLDGYGWVPFEMTPGYTENIHYSVSEPATEQEATTTETTTSRTSTETAAAATTTQASQSDTKASETVGDAAPATNHFQLPHWLLWILFGTVGVIGLLVLWHVVHFKRLNTILSDTRHPSHAIYCAYKELLRLLRFCGLPYENEPLLTYQSKTIPKLQAKNLPDTALQLIIPLVLAADMGRKAPIESEQTNAIEALTQLRKAIYQQAKPMRRLLMKLIHLI